MLPLPNPDAHEVIAQAVGLEPKKVFFGINLVRQKMMLPKVQFPKRKLAICAYISNYNTINEIKSFLAYYILQKVDNVILYCAINCDIFRTALKKEIKSGYVILYEYPWPLTKKWKFTQLSIQGSHINSCYYRHRDYYKYIISQDVDEYFYSEQYPYDLYKAIQRIFTINPGKQTLAVI